MVTGSHPVFYKQWIKVHQHPNAKLLSKIIVNKVYCLNTTNKIIKLNNTLFRDWDEIRLENLKKLYPEYKNTTLECENGLHKNTLVVLENGNTKPISEINIGDKLLNSNVYGIVKIYAKDVKLYKSNKIISSKYALNSRHKTPLIENEIYLYHLLTDSKFFWIKGNKIQLIRDYDSKIDD